MLGDQPQTGLRDEPLELLTIDEARELLHIGRTKAYAMAKLWRTTGGQAGLPVVDLGGILRVPRQALVALVAAQAIGPFESPPATRAVEPTAAPNARPRPRRTSPSLTGHVEQLDLFDLPGTSTS
jgi:hypothetical protein